MISISNQMASFVAYFEMEALEIEFTYNFNAFLSDFLCKKTHILKA